MTYLDGSLDGSRSEDLAAVSFTYPRGDLIVTEFWLPNRIHTLCRPWSVDLLGAGEVQAQLERSNRRFSVYAFLLEMVLLHCKHLKPQVFHSRPSS
jgi:hypothetical protein